jgi:hypothetical protein
MVAFSTLFAGPVLYTAEVRARFDQVGVDPRGTNRSPALRCFGDPRQWARTSRRSRFPGTPAEEQTRMTADLYLDSNCARRGGRIADHMATADVTRDLDVLRQAVGSSSGTRTPPGPGTQRGHR